MDLNILSILIITSLSVLFGGLYYSKYIVGTIWMKEVGITYSDLSKMKKNLLLTVGTIFILNFCTTVVMNFLFLALGVVTVKESIFYAMLFWVGFFGVTTLANNLLEGRSFRLFILKMLYQFLNFILIGVVLVLL